MSISISGKSTINFGGPIFIGSGTGVGVGAGIGLLIIRMLNMTLAWIPLDKTPVTKRDIVSTIVEIPTTI